MPRMQAPAANLEMPFTTAILLSVSGNKVMALDTSGGPAGAAPTTVRFH